MATALGKVMAGWAAGAPEGALDFTVTPLRPIPIHFHSLHHWGVRARVARWKLMDARGM